MNSTAARTSSSERDGLPPLGGIAPLPFSADCSRASMPCTRCGAHAALSPNFGAPATPVAWHTMQVVSYTFLPSGFRGAADAAATRDFGAAGPLLPAAAAAAPHRSRPKGGRGVASAAD